MLNVALVLLVMRLSKLSSAEQQTSQKYWNYSECKDSDANYGKISLNYATNYWYQICQHSVLSSFSTSSSLMVHTASLYQWGSPEVSEMYFWVLSAYECYDDIRVHVCFYDHTFIVQRLKWCGPRMGPWGMPEEIVVSANLRWLIKTWKLLSLEVRWKQNRIV